MITLVLGGAASGKSALAESLVAERARDTPITYVATASVDDDEDMAARVERHRARRPAAWATLEAGVDLGAAVDSCRDAVALVDSLGTWVARHRGLDPDVGALTRALVDHGRAVVVSDEVGLGVHPETEVGRRFRDQLGAVNAAVAAVADEVLFVVAGRVLRL